MEDPHDEPKRPTSHRTAVFILIAMFIGTGFLGWQVLRTSKLAITAVTKPGEYRLPGSVPKPTHLRVHITGYLDGQATVEIPGQPPRTLGPETVNEKWSLDWTTPDCLLKYTPKTVTLGRLEVEYRID